MKKTTYLILIILFGCMQDEVSLDDNFDNPCASSINFSDTSTSFATEFDGELWIPNKGSFSSYYDGKLKINAGDSLVQQGIWNIINIQIDSPFIGYNDISYSNESFMFLHHTEDRLGYRAYVDCGFVKLTELDTINGSISGYFHGTINYPEDDLELDISNGVFNDLGITPLFCETQYDPKSIEVDLFHEWRLIGIFDIEGEIISNPPCYSITSISFTSEQNNNLTEYRISGQGVINSYWTDFELVDNSKISTSSITSTRVGGAEHDVDFEGHYFQLLGNSTLSYSIDGNILSLTSEKKSQGLKFLLDE